jgi:4,5-DOPA dioxygenase extradiol
VLVHLFPAADIPVVQVSLDVRATAREHVALGEALAPLRDRGLLIMASGNVTHNLRAFFHVSPGTDKAWAPRFDATTRDVLRLRDHEQLSRLENTPDGRMAHPTPDHWRPLLVAAGASRPDDTLSFPVEGLDGGVLSMTAVQWHPRMG